MRWILQIVLGLVVMLPPHLGAAADQTAVPAVVVLPLEVRHEGRYAYLNRVINQMLLTRLSQTDGLKVLGSELKPEDRQKIRSLLQSGRMQEVVDYFDADWFVDGSMYSLKDGLQINVSLYQASGGVPVTMAVKADGEDQVIGAVGTLAKDITDAVVLEESAEQPPADLTRDDGLSGFETPHPERDYKKACTEERR